MPNDNNMTWLWYAIAAAVCAAMINVLAKFGMKGIDKDFATAIRSVVQALFVVGFAAVVGVLKNFGQLHGKAIASIVLTGVCGGLSWIFVFRAIQLAEVSKVAPIDKLSMPLGILLAVVLLRERPTPINWLGILLITGGAYLATLPKAH
jgi:transporter family protein